MNIDSCRITSAAYTDSKLFFTALYSVTASNGSVIGIDSVLGYVDLSDSSTKKLCELPDETVIGGTLAAYNGTVYLAGGIQNGEFSNAFYRYNASKKKFEKQSANLPEGRAFTKFIQYENKLIGVYGSVKSGAFPYFITYDGKSWSKSKVALSSDDYKERFFENGKSYKVYDGNLGYGNGGVFCNGAYVYGKGDSFTYQINSDTVTAFKYSAKNTLEDGNYVSTTLPGCFIAFPVTEEEGEITDISVGKKSAKGDAFDEGGEGEDISDFQPESSAVKINMTTSYAKLDTSALKNAKVTNALKGYTYGEKTKLKLAPNYGYIINSISVNAKAVSTKSNYASVQLTAANNKITASTKRVAPVKVKSLKAKVKSGKITLSWKKTDNTSGYQVQQYKKGKWKTVKTIKKAKTVKYTTKKLKKGTYKFRVRAYRKFGGKTYYGPWAAKKVKVK